MHSSRSLLSLLLLFSVLPVRAQLVHRTSPAGSDTQAIATLTSSVSAMMGSAALPNTFVESGTLTHYNLNNPIADAVRIDVEGTDKFRWEEDLAGGTTATVINGQAAQSQTATSANSLLPWQVASKKLENFPVLLMSRWLNSKGVTVNTSGVQTIDGQTLTHLSIVDYTQRNQPMNPWNRDGHRGEYELYIDPATFLPVRLHYYQDTDETHFLSLAAMDIVYSGFNSVGGMVLPSTLTRYIRNVELNILQLKVIQPNGSVTDQAFLIQ